MTDSYFIVSVRNGLLPLNLLTVLLVLLITTFSIDPLRIVLGFFMVLVFPGYSMTVLLFPGKVMLSGIERAALTIGISVAVVPLIVLVLNYTSWGITSTSTLWSIASFIFITSGIACYRQKVLTYGERFIVDFRRIRPDCSAGKSNIALSAFLVFIIVGAVWMLASAIAAPKEGEKFTEFYLLGIEGKAVGYPNQLAIDEEGRLLVGVVNHEYREVSYRIAVGIAGENIHEIASFMLSNGEKWEQEVRFSPTRLGHDQKVELLLYKDGLSEPYRTLHIWINVGITS